MIFHKLVNFLGRTKQNMKYYIIVIIFARGPKYFVKEHKFWNLCFLNSLNLYFWQFRILSMIYSKADFVAILKCSKTQKWKEEMISAMWGLQNRNRSPRRFKRFRRRPRNMHRNRGFAIDEMNSLKESKPLLFQRMFRMDVTSFDELVELLDPVLRKNEKYSVISSGSVISTATRLAVTLRWLAGGSYIDLCFAWGISKTSFYSHRGVLWPTIAALDDLLQLGIPLSNDECPKIGSWSRYHLVQCPDVPNSLVASRGTLRQLPLSLDLPLWKA